MMWAAAGWIAWIASAAIFLYLLVDFFIVNRSHSEDALLSSREGVDELFDINRPIQP